MITFIITTYNRVNELVKLLQSLVEQTSQAFETIIVDDNSSDARVEQVAGEFLNNHRGAFFVSDVTDDKRKKSVRYAANINIVMGNQDKAIHGDLIAYLCDDVELAPTYVETVTRYFAEHPERGAGYVSEQWVENGTVTKVLWFGKDVAVVNAFCALDHSQVIHRREHTQRWVTHPLAWQFADGIMFERLLGRVGAIYPIGDETPLITNKILATSVCRQDIETALAKLKE